MPDNTHRFTGRVEDYERYRQRYPAEQVLTLLRTWCGLTPQASIADIGAGTGMLAEVFLSNGNHVLAVEPNADMRSACQRLRTRWPALEVFDATAETTGLPSASVDIVAAGRAFHWFDKDRALPEFRRILKPGGWVALVSLGRSHQDSPGNTAFEHLLTHHGTDYKYIRAGYRIHDDLHTLFPGAFHQAQLHGEQQLDWSAFQGQTMSLSVVPQPGHPNHEAFQRELRSHFDTFAVDGVLTVATTYWITAGSFSTR